MRFVLFFKENREESVKQFAVRNGFSDTAQDYMDRICRLTDGAGSDRYSVFQFLQLINQNVFGKLYQPRIPNDKHLFKLWQEKLVKNGVDIRLDSDVKYMTVNSLKTQVEINSVIYSAGKVLLCIPPRPFLTLSKNINFDSRTTLYDLYNKNLDITRWVERNSYALYIPITFHWKDKRDLPEVWGFPGGDWGVAFIVLTDYMKPEGGYELVISTCITRVDDKSSVINKTPLECSEDELISETFRQLSTSFPGLERFDKALVYDKTQDTAYVACSNEPYLPMMPSGVDNILYVGTQNGNTYYSFTSMESAVTNALFALREIGELSECERIHDNPYTVRRVFWIVILIIILIWFLYYVRNCCN